MSDLSHHYEALDRALKRIGIILIDDHGHLRSGKSAQCIALLRKILLFTSSVLAQQMLLRGCPSHAPDKRLVISAFDLVREKIKYSPSITVDQFFKEVRTVARSSSAYLSYSLHTVLPSTLRIHLSILSAVTSS